MRHFLVILALLAGLMPACVLAWQDARISLERFLLTGTYSIEPIQFECTVGQACDFPTYSGRVTVEALIAPDGKLVDFILLIDAKRVPVGVVEKYGGKGPFDLGYLMIGHNAFYAPPPAREEAIGFGPPYLIIRGIGFDDGSCESTYRYVTIAYLLESGEYEMSDACEQE